MTRRRFQFGLARLLVATAFFAAAAAAMRTRWATYLVVPCAVVGGIILVNGLRRPSKDLVENLPLLIQTALIALCVVLLIVRWIW